MSIPSKENGFLSLRAKTENKRKKHQKTTGKFIVLIIRHNINNSSQ